jgi:dihydroorotate dehydrogenase (NAD+) catalytic subunit
MIDLSVKFLGKKFPNPLVLASGILGMSAASMINVVKNGAGAVTTKSANKEGRVGNPNPKVITYESGMLNCYGLTNAGLAHENKEIEKYKAKIKDHPIIISIFGFSLAEFEESAKLAEQSEADFVEVNISCPNVQHEHGRPYACTLGAPTKVIETVKKHITKPIIVKLSPNVTDIVEIAREVEKAGADAISAINTLGPGMVIDIDIQKPILSMGGGGMSGPAIRPLAIKMVHDIYKAVKIPILGLGGITTGKDAIEMLMAGSSLVGIGSGVYYRGVDIFKKVNEEIKVWMDKNNYKKVRDLTGVVH